ncbi:MAG TPA: OmpH family outer membrane protein [Flavobacterium sp.]
MLKNKINLLVFLNTFLLAFVLIFLFIYHAPSPEVVYVNKMKLFENFAMTKEVKQRGENEFNRRKLEIENLYTKLNITTDEKSRRQIFEKIVKAKNDLDAFNQAFINEESNKIWVRINNYTQLFSNTQKYKLIVGSEGKETVLFGDPALDVTNQLVAFMNKKYEGG